MATVEFIGRRVTDAESVTNWGSTKITGGGGSWSSIPALDPDTFRQGSNSVAYTASNAPDKLHFCWYNYTAAFGTNLNFGSAGADNGNLVYIWAQHALALEPTGLATTLPGLGIAMGSNGTAAANLAWWTVYGSENYPGGWVRLVLDPRQTPTASGASFNLGDVDYIGIVATTTTNKAVPVIYIDAIDIGSGIRYHGSGTIDSFDELVQKDQDTVASRYGVIESLENTDTVIQIRGILEIGSGANIATNFTSNDKVIVFDTPRYINSTPAFANALNSKYQKIFIRDGGTQVTNVALGTKIGTGDDAAGRNGLLFLGNNQYDYNFLIESGVTSVKLYGTTIRSFNNDIIWSGNSDFEVIGCFYDNNGQFQPTKDVQIRNTSFLNNSGVNGALSWASGLDIKNSSFVNNTNIFGSGVGVNHPTGLSVIYDNLTFSNNDYDIYFSQAASGDLIVQATNGANPSTFIKTNPDSFVEIQNTLTLTITNIIPNSEVRIYQAGTTLEIDGTESSSSSFAYAFQGGDPNVDIRIFHLDYLPLNIINFTLPASNSSIPISQIFDRNYSNPI